MDKKGYYKILGVSENASGDELKKAFRKRCRDTHPDLHPNDKEKEDEFKKINEAYETLSDKDKREAYDNGFDGSSQFGGGGDFGGIDPMMREFMRRHMGGFGGMGGFGDDFAQPKPKPNSAQRYNGDNVMYDLNISFEEALYGMKDKEISIEIYDECPDCNNTGLESGHSDDLFKPCPHCHQTGYMQSIRGSMVSISPCPHCQGSGWIRNEEHLCKKCHGEGRIQASHTIKVNIPKGCDDRVTLRCAGGGNVGLNHGARGDLFVRVRVGKSKYFLKDGPTIHTFHHISPFKAILGGKETIVTPYGEAEVTIPKYMENEHKMRLKGQGAFSRELNGNGDLIVTFFIDIPTDLSKEQRKEIETLEKKCREDGWCKRAVEQETEQKQYLKEIKEKYNI